MMKIEIVSVGKIKEKFYRDAVAEYAKRISGYSKIKFVELKDEKLPNKLNSKKILKIKDVEADRILNVLDFLTYVIVLDKGGTKNDSVEFANHIKKLTLNGKSHITFVIGGSVGLSDKVLNRANHVLSFSDMTFPHQLMKVILLEQVYRAFKIIKGETYHK